MQRPTDIPSALPAIKEIPSRHWDERRGGSEIDTLVIHSMYNPEPNPDSGDNFSARACKECLDRYEVSAHYLIERSGQIWRTVPEEKRAWHAGASRMPDPADGREAVNHFSIGIELAASETSGIDEKQYQALAALTADIARRFPIRNIVGHSDIAPGRKTDPWHFDWGYFKELLAGLMDCGNLKFPAAV